MNLADRKQTTRMLAAVRLGDAYIPSHNLPRTTQQTKKNHCQHQEHVHCVRLLLEAGANVNQSENTGQTSLWYPARRNDTDCVELLLMPILHIGVYHSGLH